MEMEGLISKKNLSVGTQKNLNSKTNVLSIKTNFEYENQQHVSINSIEEALPEWMIILLKLKKEAEEKRRIEQEN